MTKAQQRALDAIIGKLEALQHKVASDRVRDRLGNAKTYLIDALTVAE